MDGTENGKREAEAVALLRELQWSGADDCEAGGYVSACPCCEAHKDDGEHFEHCRLAALIA